MRADSFYISAPCVVVTGLFWKKNAVLLACRELAEMIFTTLT